MGLRYTDYLNRDRSLVENPRKPVLLTFEPAGDDESDIAWAVKGRIRDLGRYALCPHLDGAISSINAALRQNDGIGRGGEALIQDLNDEMIASRFKLGSCAVKDFMPVINGVLEHQRLEREQRGDS